MGPRGLKIGFSGIKNQYFGTKAMNLMSVSVKTLTFDKLLQKMQLSRFHLFDSGLECKTQSIHHNATCKTHLLLSSSRRP